MARVTRGSVRLAGTGPPLRATQELMQLSSPLLTPAPNMGRKRKAVKQDPDTSPTLKDSPSTPKSTRKRPRAVTIAKNEDINELPHNLGSIPILPPDETTSDNGPPLKQKPRARKTTSVKKESVDELVKKATATPDVSPKKSKAKDNGYGLKPGQTPYPNFARPTLEECHEVTRLLSTIHGEVKPPKTIPIPSLTVSGCGEVPSVLDALIRTRLSAATSGTNSSRAFAGLVAKFGILQSGVGKGSVDWNKVRLADTKDIFEAIKSGGLADVKSKDIKKILQMVWEENQARKDALRSAETSESANQGHEQSNVEVEKVNEEVLSLDHLHRMTNDEAFNAMTRYPGIGPKTASCVLLFCLQRPSFAVDTHVFRLSKWLGWVPEPGDPTGLPPNAKSGAKFAGPTRNSTYAHLEVRIPDELKYSLHQLFIKHGKTCPRCRAITGEGSEGWEKGCAIDHLVKRGGGRKGEGDGNPVQKGSTAGKGKGKGKGKRKGRKDEESEEESELSDLGSEDESGDSLE
ncbi:DNA glycosylase [Amniculicola lignicola CBS 123094]|uniref:DNA glycosylase n=1 Tax=Amniculicola lignicola CBS 123094 TaxID=1392246 RepID=A0A6A5W5X7_9PLEO|nr:DNA glycosylase [Amniculicola lignicola CBS 123094]